MTYTEAIKEGLRLVNRNWQLVLVQFVVSITGCIGFFIIIGVPLIIALVMLGVNLAELGDPKAFFKGFGDPVEILGRHLGLIIVFSAGVLAYLTLLSAVWIFSLGGSVGILKKSFLEPSSRFTLEGFLDEGKKFFLPLTGYTLFVALVIIGVMFVLGAMGGAAVSIPEAMGLESVAEIFLKVFFMLSSMVIGLTLLSGIFAVSLQGAVLLVFEKRGIYGSFRGGYSYLKEKPEAFGLYAVLFMAYFLAYSVLALIGFPFKFIPVVGTLLMMPYQLLSYVLQSYLCLVILATALAYYGFTGEGSIPSGDTSPGEGPRQAPLRGGSASQ